MNDFEVIGAKRLEKLNGRPAVFTLNHSSIFDVMYARIALKYGAKLKANTLGMKHFIKKYPFVGYMGKVYDVAATDPYDKYSMVTALRDVSVRLKRGESIIVSPEGVFTATGRLNDFLPGPTYIAVKLKTPVVPMWISGAYRALPIGAKMLRRSKVTLEYHEPILYEDLPSDMNDKEKNACIMKNIRELYEKMETRDIANGMLVPNDNAKLYEDYAKFMEDRQKLIETLKKNQN